MGWERGGSPEHINMILARVFGDLAQRYERRINEKDFKDFVVTDARPGGSRANCEGVLFNFQAKKYMSGGFGLIELP